MKNKRFFYEGTDQPITSAEEYFRIQYFLVIIDSAVISLKKSFEIYHAHEALHGFLYNSDSVKKVR